MPKKLSSNGFSVVEMIVALLVVAAIALGGFFVWQHNKDDNSKDKSSNTSQSSGNGSSQQAGEDKNTDPSEGGKYLVIKEWGVRFLLPESLRGDIYYKSWTNSLDVHGASFASKKLDALAGDDSCSIKSNSDGTTGPGLAATLTRLDPKNPGQESLEFYRSERTYLVKIDTYEFYTANDSKGISCVSETHNNLSSTEQGISDQLKSAFKELELVQQ